MTFWLTLLAVFLMWTMWICAFMHQMYPLARPTVAKAPEYKVKCAEENICINFDKVSCVGDETANPPIPAILEGYEFTPADPVNNKPSTCKAKLTKADK